jgi:hypothetical protein
VEGDAGEIDLEPGRSGYDVAHFRGMRPELPASGQSLPILGVPMRR